MGLTTLSGRMRLIVDMSSCSLSLDVHFQLRSVCLTLVKDLPVLLMIFLCSANQLMEDLGLCGDVRVRRAVKGRNIGNTSLV